MRGGDPFSKDVAELKGEVAQLKIRLANTVRRGKCTDVDAEKHLCRIEIGKGVDGEPQKSPWVPYGQHAGALKIHVTPTVGQNMIMHSEGGDFEQAVAIPFTWNEANPSPSTSKDEIVATFLKKVKFTVQDGKLIVEVPDTMIKVDDDHQIHLTKQSLIVKGDVSFRKGTLKHSVDDSEGKSIDSTHKHGGVIAGGDNTDVPV